MFERFTDRARRVVVLAQEEARLLKHGYIGTEHLLLGLVAEEDGIAAAALGRSGVELDAARAEVVELMGAGERPPSGHIPFTPSAKKALQQSLREAICLNHKHISTEHLLLGLLGYTDDAGTEVLRRLGVDFDALRADVVRLIEESPPPMVPKPRQSTPAFTRAMRRAAALAGDGDTGSHHLLLALLTDEQSIAFRILTDLGVSGDQVEALAAGADPTGTSDEVKLDPTAGD
jgi:ATP-dependent Clp protease ATP-binding subunit ClpA